MPGVCTVWANVLPHGWRLPKRCWIVPWRSPSTAYRKCRASLARGNALFLHAMRWQERDIYFRRAVLEPYHCTRPETEVTVRPKFVTVSVLLLLLKIQGFNVIMSSLCGPTL